MIVSPVGVRAYRGGIFTVSVDVVEPKKWYAVAVNERVCCASVNVTDVPLVATIATRVPAGRLYACAPEPDPHVPDHDFVPLKYCEYGATDMKYAVALITTDVDPCETPETEYTHWICPLF
ncbi:hypothetical protein D3229_09925 [Leucobacter aridicollis]|nr:hypothetical protein [Leucobacter aridicollis]